MGQDEIEEYLRERRGNYFSSMQLAKIMGLSQSTVSANLSVLLKRKLINRKVVGNRPNSFVYGINE